MSGSQTVESGEEQLPRTSAEVGRDTPGMQPKFARLAEPT